MQCKWAHKWCASIIFHWQLLTYSLRLEDSCKEMYKTKLWHWYLDQPILYTFKTDILNISQTLSCNSGCRIGSIRVHNVTKKAASNRDTTTFKLDKICLKEDDFSSVFPMLPTTTNIKHIVSAMPNNLLIAAQETMMKLYTS